MSNSTERSGTAIVERRKPATSQSGTAISSPARLAEAPAQALPAAPVAETKGFLSPAEIAEKTVDIAKAKCRLRMIPMILLGMLAGVYIGFGAQLCTMVSHDVPAHLGIGSAKFLGGSVFSVGLILVVLAGAELFTGNCLILTGVLSAQCTLRGMMRNWSVVYMANFAGSLALAFVMFYSGLWKTANSAVGTAAINIAAAKVSLPFGEALLRGVGCNWLVCLAVWLAIAGKDPASKILGIYFPIMAFVASGFEHCIANMYFIPIGLLLKANTLLAANAGIHSSVADLTWGNFISRNLVPVTIGNILGGSLFVGGVYYLTYLHRKD